MESTMRFFLKGDLMRFVRFSDTSCIAYHQEAADEISFSKPMMIFQQKDFGDKISE
ncbi:hypothetical protein [Endozoicomonas sp. ALC066]|uniref:hypothetical protein n=1 Tax=Endozoicomonas sp. ALC066 TaxID=3403078 RepID=UPI003BB6B2E5